MRSDRYIFNNYILLMVIWDNSFYNGKQKEINGKN